MHTIGYCESEHLWSWLRDPKFDFFSSDRVPESALWGHPKYISQVYRDSPGNVNEILLLANSIAHYRKTNLIPLIKDQFNLFRIGLIKKCFPKARFVFVIRDYEYWGNRKLVNGYLINLFYTVLDCFGLSLDEQDKLLEPILPVDPKILIFFDDIIMLIQIIIMLLHS